LRSPPRRATHLHEDAARAAEEKPTSRNEVGHRTKPNPKPKPEPNPVPVPTRDQDWICVSLRSPDQSVWKMPSRSVRA